MASERTAYEAVIIGTGQGGKPLAQAFGEAGWSTAIIERDRVGGTCVNYGCTPTKTMVASARVAHLARRAGDYGVDVSDVRVDLARVVARKRRIVESFREGSRSSLEGTDHVELILGEARFEGPHRLEVRLNDGGVRHIEGKRVFVNTGTRPMRPPVEGLGDVPTLDNASIMELDRLPDPLLVLGGGYVGVEFAQMFRRFGSRVTLVHRGERILAREDTDVSATLADILREDGVELLLGAQAVRAASPEKGGVELVVNHEGKQRTLRGSHLLVATGRVPNTDRLGLDAAGVVTDSRGYINVNDRLETAAAGVWALGDVKGGPAFTHVSYDDFRILKSNVLESGDADVRGRAVPYTVFTDPQLGRIGMTEREAVEHGLDVRVARLPMAHVARAIETGETRGFIKAVVGADSRRILGAAVLGIEGGELASMLQVAMMGGLPYTALRDGVFSHPTLSESLNTLFSGLDD